MKHKITKQPKSIIEIEAEIEADVFEKYFDKAFKNISENMEIDGFRKGKAPENIVLSKVPEMYILEEMAQLAISDHYPKIVLDEKLDVISRPEISITKLARKNPLEFKITTTIMPEVVLPDYKSIAKEINNEKEEEINVTEEEIEKTIMDIRKSRAKNKKDIKEIKPEDLENQEEIKDDLPEFNDEFVKGMGPFENVEDFKTKLKENLKLEKTNQAREKRRLKMVEKIIEGANIDTPEILIESETEKILQRMEGDISQMGLKFEEYLSHLKKTREDLVKDFRGDAEKKAKLGLILNQLSKLENIIADASEVEKEANHIIEHYQGADPEQVRLYALNVLTNEKIFQFLEEQK
jgi:trigger factor